MLLTHLSSATFLRFLCPFETTSSGTLSCILTVLGTGNSNNSNGDSVGGNWCATSTLFSKEYSDRIQVTSTSTWISTSSCFSWLSNFRVIFLYVFTYSSIYLCVHVNVNIFMRLIIVDQFMIYRYLLFHFCYLMYFSCFMYAF